MAVNMTIFDYLDYDFSFYKSDPPMKLLSYKSNTKVAKEYLLPIYEHVRSLKNEEEIYDYFKNKFFLGKRKHVPYADYKKFLVSLDKSKTMLTISNFGDFLFIINTTGSMSGGEIFLDECVFPPKMSADDYRRSLTAEDIDLIIDDSKRLCRLHRKSESIMEFVNKRLRDYEIDFELKGQ